MVAAAIAFTQGANVGAAGQAAGYPPSYVGVVGLLVLASNGSNTGVTTWTYSLLAVPPGSALTIGVKQSGATPTWGFTPDVVGSYRVQLTTQDGSGNTATDVRVFAVPELSGRLIPPFGGNAADMNFGGSNAQGWAPAQDAYDKEIDVLWATIQPPVLFTGLGGLAGARDGQVVEVMGYVAVGDGGEGFFQWVAADTRTTPTGSTAAAGSDGGTYTPGSGGAGVAGRWCRVFWGAFNAKHFGGKGAGPTFDDTAAAQNAIASAYAQRSSVVMALNGLAGFTTFQTPKVFFPAGRWAFGTAPGGGGGTVHGLEIPGPMTIEGEAGTIFMPTNAVGNTKGLVRVAAGVQLKSIQFVGGYTAIILFGASVNYGTFPAAAGTYQRPLDMDDVEFVYQAGPSIWQDCSAGGNNRSYQNVLTCHNFRFVGPVLYWGCGDYPVFSDGIIEWDQANVIPPISDDTTALSGTATVAGTAVSFTASQSLPAGQLITFASQPGVGYMLASSVSGFAGTLTTAYSGSGGAGTGVSTALPLGLFNSTDHLILKDVEIDGQQPALGNLWPTRGTAATSIPSSAIFVGANEFIAQNIINFDSGNIAVRSRVTANTFKGLATSSFGLPISGAGTSNPLVLTVDNQFFANNSNLIEVYEVFPSQITVRNSNDGTLESCWGVWVDAGVSLVTAQQQHRSNQMIRIDSAGIAGSWPRIRQSAESLVWQRFGAGTTDVTANFASYYYANEYQLTEQDAEPQPNLFLPGIYDLAQGAMNWSPSNLQFNTTNTLTGYVLSDYDSLTYGGEGSFQSNAWGANLPAGVYCFSLYVKADFEGLLTFGMNYDPTLAFLTGTQAHLASRKFHETSNGQAGANSVYQRVWFQFYWPGGATSQVKFLGTVTGCPHPVVGFSMGLFMVNKGSRPAPYVFPTDVATAPSANNTNARIRAMYYGAGPQPPTTGSYIPGDDYVVDPPVAGQCRRFTCVQSSPLQWMPVAGNLAVVRVTHAGGGGAQASPYTGHAGETVVVDSSAGTVVVNAPVLLQGETFEVVQDASTAISNTITVNAGAAQLLGRPGANITSFVAAVTSTSGDIALGAGLKWVNLGAAGGKLNLD